MSLSLTMTNSPYKINHHWNIYDWPQYIENETNIKIGQEQHNYQIKKCNLSKRDMNFLNEDISWASIDADLFNTYLDMFLRIVNTDEMYKIVTNICPEICKNMFCHIRVQGSTNYPEPEGL